MNRDWHNRPLQGGGRDSYDYGRSNAPFEREPMRHLWVWPAGLIGGLLFYVLVCGVVINLLTKWLGL